MLFCLSFPFPPLYPDAFASPSPEPGLQTYANMPSLQLTRSSIYLAVFLSNQTFYTVVHSSLLSFLALFQIQTWDYRNDRKRIKNDSLSLLVLFISPGDPSQQLVCILGSPMSMFFIHVLQAHFMKHHTYCSANCFYVFTIF